MPASTVANVKDSDGLTVEGEQHTIAVLPPTVEELTDVDVECIAFRSKWTALG